jgi:aspartate/glutamate racemase
VIDVKRAYRAVTPSSPQGCQGKALLGVIGGMGVEAGINFDLALQDRFQTIRSDAEHPCRVAALSGAGPSPAASIAQAALGLKERGADHFVLACMTAHAFLEEVQDLSGLSFINVVDLVPTCTWFGTTVMAQTDLVKRFRLPTDKEQEIIQQAIWGVKVGDFSLAPQVRRIASRYDSVIAGCTELPLILGGRAPVDFIS